MRQGGVQRVRFSVKTGFSRRFSPWIGRFARCVRGTGLSNAYNGLLGAATFGVGVGFLLVSRIRDLWGGVYVCGVCACMWRTHTHTLEISRFSLAEVKFWLNRVAKIDHRDGVSFTMSRVFEKSKIDIDRHKI